MCGECDVASACSEWVMEIKQLWEKKFFYGATPAQFTQGRLNLQWTINPWAHTYGCEFSIACEFMEHWVGNMRGFFSWETCGRGYNLPEKAFAKVRKRLLNQKYYGLMGDPPSVSYMDLSSINAKWNNSSWYRSLLTRTPKAWEAGVATRVRTCDVGHSGRHALTHMQSQLTVRQA